MSSDAPKQDARPPRAGSKWKTRAIWGAVAGVLLVATVLIAMAVIPRWWAQRIGGQIDGSSTSGTGIGLFYGFVFTALPLLALWFGFRRRRNWKVALWVLAAALVLALPNLMTLGIVIGNGNAAHAGERILDVEAPNFRAASLIGAIVAVVAVAGLVQVLLSRRRAKRRERDLRDELRAREAASSPAPAAKGE